VQDLEPVEVGIWACQYCGAGAVPEDQTGREVVQRRVGLVKVERRQLDGDHEHLLIRETDKVAMEVPALCQNS
jgi:hypothetical protein